VTLKGQKRQTGSGLPWFDLSRSPEVNKFGTVRKAVYDFLLVNNSNFVAISHRLRDMSGFAIFSQTAGCDGFHWNSRLTAMIRQRLWWRFLVRNETKFSKIPSPCLTISFKPNVLKLNVLAAESSVSMRSSSSHGVY